ncbi:bacteriocin immunity protein [Longimicrobium terrae]|uniref:Bacteriocin immunity protein n=1 Tax=Longimicrobium terrae TaxID=1639882 RepID=A0A841H2W3_9BACT|nr:bacteriocin immunity protein [Longimicrobium terrae]MBB4637812.1 hypothetical protein [Longimicrobium terrae]MBB6072333.1 hypothetical protein [Longimicrobium terrae]NNC31252.1 hypothetical protein [Longimicrobium terrae]
MPRLTRAELVELVVRLQKGEGSDDEASSMLETLEENLPDPNLSDLIFYPEREMTADEIVDRALAHRPIQL